MENLLISIYSFKDNQQMWSFIDQCSGTSLWYWLRLEYRSLVCKRLGTDVLSNVALKSWECLWPNRPYDLKEYHSTSDLPGVKLTTMWLKWKASPETNDCCLVVWSIKHSSIKRQHIILKSESLSLLTLDLNTAVVFSTTHTASLESPNTTFVLSHNFLTQTVFFSPPS